MMFGAFSNSAGGEPVSEHPNWRWQAGAGVGLAALVFMSGLRARRRASPPLGFSLRTELLLAANALVAGILAGLAVANMLVESFAFGGWLRSLALVAVGLLAPLVTAAALVSKVGIPSFDRVLAASDDRIREPLALMLGLILIAVCVLAVQTALGLVFVPRYRDFPFAPLTAATVPFLLLSLQVQREAGPRAISELLASAVLVISAIYIVFNEGLANWQSLWLSLALLVLAFILARARAAPNLG